MEIENKKAGTYSQTTLEQQSRLGNAQKIIP
jgi:hypothetical protein